MKFNICVPIPIKNGNINENKAIIERALGLGANIIELRFDYIDNIHSITLDFLKNLLKFIQPEFSAIFSFRESSQDKQIKISKDERLNITKILIEAQPEFFEVEMNADNHILSEAVFLAKIKVVNLIFSYYNFEKTPTYNESFDLLEKFIYKLEYKLFIDPKIINKSIYKLIFTAQKFEDNLIPLKLLNTFSGVGRKMISFCLGELGIFSRITSVKPGSFLIFASLENKPEQGEIDIRTMKEILKLL